MNVQKAYMNLIVRMFFLYVFHCMMWITIMTTLIALTICVDTENNIRDDGASALAAGLKFFPNLVLLFLRGNEH